MKTEIFSSNDGGMEVRTMISDAEVSRLGYEIYFLAVKEAGTALAAKILEQKGQELIAKAPLDSILNQAVAEAVLKIGAATIKK